MLGRLLGEDISLQLNYSQLPATVEADAGMMEQVLLNLAVNARDAMPRGGQLAIRIAIVDVNKDPRPSAIPTRGRDVSSASSKSDTGCGIPPENLARIFEPFFTTKEIGKGTGLGLATVYGIVKQHQGWIEVESTVGKGTTFRIYLPFVRAWNAEQKNNSTANHRCAAARKPSCWSRTSARARTRRPPAPKIRLQSLQAANGNRRARVSGRNTKRIIPLLLTDLVMPGNMNGHELAEKLRAEKGHGLKVIFTSGYSADIVGKDFKLDSGSEFPPETLPAADPRPHRAPLPRWEIN